MGLYKTIAELFQDILSDEKKKKRGPGGSVPGRSTNIKRDFKQCNHTLFRKYFCSNPTFDDEKFKRRFHVKRQIFNRVVEAVTGMILTLRKSGTVQVCRAFQCT